MTSGLCYDAPNGAVYALKPAAPSEKLLAFRLRRGAYVYEDGQLMKRCSHCKDNWPADSEFFYSASTGDGLNDWCKACYRENRRQSEREVA